MYSTRVPGGSLPKAMRTWLVVAVAPLVVTVVSASVSTKTTWRQGARCDGAQAVRYPVVSMLPS